MADLLFDINGHGQRGERRFRQFDDFTEDQLRVRYRFGRQSILYLTNLLADDLPRGTRRNHALRPQDQVLIALRFFASGSFLVGDTVGVDKSTVSRVVTAVSQALVAKQHRFIKWPSTIAELVANKNAFYRRGGFPCVIGCVDGTHIKIQAPSQHENGYVNRRGFHSINVQAVCNHEGTPGIM